VLSLKNNHRIFQFFSMPTMMFVSPFLFQLPNHKHHQSHVQQPSKLIFVAEQEIGKQKNLTL